MNSLSDSQLDDAILSATLPRWRKIALVIVLAEKELGIYMPGHPAQYLIAERIEALVKDGRLLAQGDLKKWRYSEVRKPEDFPT
jgi:hypothetical protein